MKIVSDIKEMQSLADSLRRAGKTIGLVPTMGFLHEGHLSLMRAARKACDVVVVSIFVNPTQFGPQEDFERYPRDEEGDHRKCETAGADILFKPRTADMYPEKPSVFVVVEGLSDRMEGSIRPGHFRGVATVVAKLFHLVKPHRAFFGRKDFQQCAVIRSMVKGLNLDVEILVHPTVREQDGLAMSSRNSYLSLPERQAAPVVYRALQAAEQLVRDGERDPAVLRSRMQAVLREQEGVTVEYVEIADPDTLELLTTARSTMVLLIAVRIGRTRLIDNLLIL